MSDTNDSISDAVDQLVNQLQSQNMPPANVKSDIKKEDLESFLLQYSSQLIKGSVEFVDDLKQYIVSAPTAEDVTAMATLVNSSANAIETLNKLMITNKNIDAKFKLKQMDIDSKKELQEKQIEGRMLMNREELLKHLIEDSKIVNVEVSDAQTPKTSLEET
jgi:hypothetical protein